MQKFIELANSISEFPPDSPQAHKAGDPEVSLLAATMNERLAEIALLCNKTPMNAEQVAEIAGAPVEDIRAALQELDRKSTRLNSSH